ncbi:MAG TPA: hypothetical protein VFZ23_12320, partial [Pyrinomonadaceae bacterium]
MFELLPPIAKASGNSYRGKAGDVTWNFQKLPSFAGQLADNLLAFLIGQLHRVHVSQDNALSSHD